MLNIFKEKQNNQNYSILYTDHKNRKNNVIKNESLKNEYKNIIYYPSSTKEWSTSVYSYNKSYQKMVVVADTLVNKLLWGYSNMLTKKKVFFRRRRSNKNRYSAKKIFLSKTELKHTNTKLLIILYVFNKRKLMLQKYLRKLLMHRKIYKSLHSNDSRLPVSFEKKLVYILKKKAFMYKKINNINDTLKYKKIHKNRVFPMLKNKLLAFSKWNTSLFSINQNLLTYVILNMKKKNFDKSYKRNILAKKIFTFKSKLFGTFKSKILGTIKAISLNRIRFNNLILNFRNLGIISLLQKMYGKKVEIKLIELKSLHLNSDIFSSALALKLKNRKNKAVRVLRKAITQIVKIPDLHTLITFDDNTKNIDKNKFLSNIKQQAVSGVRFEASGRLTKRLTAMRAIFKHRYVGSLKNIRSSFNTKSSTILRGHVKSNLQYTIINSKTRNGSFGLKGWVSSH